MDLTHRSFVVDDRLCATCISCFKYLSIVLNSESLEGRDCILFNFISKLLTESVKHSGLPFSFS